jgi:hypothetical protein
MTQVPDLKKKVVVAVSKAAMCNLSLSILRREVSTMIQACFVSCGIYSGTFLPLGPLLFIGTNTTIDRNGVQEVADGSSNATLSKAAR